MKAMLLYDPKPIEQAPPVPEGANEVLQIVKGKGLQGTAVLVME